MRSPKYKAEGDQSSSPEPKPKTPSLPQRPPRHSISVSQSVKVETRNTAPLSKHSYRGSGENISNEVQGMAHNPTTTKNKESYDPRTPNVDKVSLFLDGNLGDMTKNWSHRELQNSRRIVAFQKLLYQSTLEVTFDAVSGRLGDSLDILSDSFDISCIKRDDADSYYSTQDDIIRLIEWLFTWSDSEPLPYKLGIEEKGRVLHSLGNLHPLTVSKTEAATEDFFKLIMGLSDPQPCNLEVEIKVFPWETLRPALEEIINSYSNLLETVLRQKHDRQKHDRLRQPKYNRLRPPTAFASASKDSNAATNADHLYHARPVWAMEGYDFTEMNPDELQKYISGVADALLSIVKGLNPNRHARNRILKILPDLLEIFALKIGHKGSTPWHHNFMNFILKNRCEIFASFETKHSEQENLQAAPVPSSDNLWINDTVGAWLRNVHLSQAQSENDTDSSPTPNRFDNVNRANVDFESAENAFNSPRELSAAQKSARMWLVAYHQLIPDTEGYDWLLSRLQKEIRLEPGETSIMDTIKSEIKRSLRPSPRANSNILIDTYDAIFEVDWDIMDFLKKQQYNTKLQDAIETVITLTTSRQDPYITTCGQYITETWPSSGSTILQLIKDMVGSKLGNRTTRDPSIGLRLSAKIDGTKVTVTADGPMTSVVEVGEQLAWLGAALRISPFDQGIIYCSPHIRVIGFTPFASSPLLITTSQFTAKYKIAFRNEFYLDSDTSSGSCWHHLFKNPTVVQGYPIPTRTLTGTGAEIPLNIMAGLAQAQRVDCFKGMAFIKGFSTILVPTTRIGDTILWHLFYNKDGHRISYLDSTITNLGYAKLLDLEHCRHILGWCPNVKFYAGRDVLGTIKREIANTDSAGSEKANYSVLNSSLPSPHEGCSLAGIYVSPGRCIVGGPAFGLGVKDTPAHVSRSGYIPRLQWIATKYVLLWDEAEKRGWLVNGTSALLHIVRASLAYNNTDKFNSAFIFREKDFKESTAPFRADSAIDMLINPKNLALKLYREKDGYLLLESRIEYFYNILEKLIDHQADIAGERGVNMADKPRRYLEGWEFNDLVMSRDPLYPRVASLEPRGKSWVDFARAIHAVTLFGSGFGDIMKSTSADMCEHWAEMPKEEYYLAACLSDMSQLVRDNQVLKENQVRVSKDIIWHTPTSLFRTCRCRGILGQDHSEPVQALLPAAMSKILLPRKLAIPLEPGSRGAIIFGHNSNFSWVYDDNGPPSEGKLPLPNISDVDSAKDSGIDLSMPNMDSPRLNIISSNAQKMTESPDNRHLEISTPQSTSLRGNETFSQEEYTVGILCALSKELLAVRALFDKKHGNLEISFGDTNHYALGQIGKHMVVTSCLPEGEYGTSSAADSAANMRRSFPNIRFCLLVGIGGGAPTQDNDIRLGDVVVSLPVGKYPGIVQYDRGKEKENNVFELTGSLPPPPRYLTTAISSLRSDPDLPAYPLRPYIDEILNRVSESVGWRYKHPGQDHDQLFKAACSKCQTRDECANGDDHITKRRQRPTDDPEIHYGLIASGNHVIKNSQTRDKWAQDHGVLCFEMEAAGIMNIFPSLVIRGICDYADAFKNKLWQEYAAATAAAYAKLLLGVVASPEKSHDGLGLTRRRGSASERPDEQHHKRRRLD